MIGALARAFEKADKFARAPFGFSNPPVEILSDVLQFPALYRTMENFAYGSPLTRGTGQARQLTADTKGAAEAVTNFLPMAPLAKAGVGAPVGLAIKPKGGNWLPSNVRGRVTRLKQGVEGEIVTPEMVAEHQAVEGVDLSPQLSVNRWLDTKFKKYLENEMGTPEDPLRDLADRGITHMPDPQSLARHGEWEPEGLGSIRAKQGFPPEGYAQNEMGKGWENLTDSYITPSAAKDLPNFDYHSRSEPWLRKLDPNAKVNYFSSSPDALAVDFDFPHLVDELLASVSDNTLPQQLRWSLKDLEKVTVPQAVERVHQINQFRAVKAAEAEKAGMMQNLQAAPRMADDSLNLSFVEQPGGRWVDIPDTVNENGMQVCTSIGKSGGWCTQAEWAAKNYGSGDHRLTALLDAEGRPHVQVKISKSKFDPEQAEMRRVS